MTREMIERILAEIPEEYDLTVGTMEEIYEYHKGSTAECMVDAFAVGWFSHSRYTEGKERYK